MNTVILIGRLVKDPELNYLQSGQAVTKFTLAVDRNNEKKEADFLNCVSFAKLAETVNNYCKKGRQIAVTGRIQVRNYEANDGRKVYVTEILANSVEFLAESKAQQEAPTGGILTGAKVLADDDCPFD